VVEDGGLGRLRRAGVVVARDCVQELGPRVWIKGNGTLLDQPRAEVDVTEQSPLGRLPEPRPGLELDGAADVVQQGGGEQQVGAQPRMELTELATDGRDTDRVLEQPAGVGVVPIRCRRQCPEPSPDLIVAEDRSDELAQPVVGDFAGQELEEAVELVRVSAHRRREPCGILVGGGLDRADVELQPVAVALHSPEHAHCVPLAEPRVEQLDVVPDPALDAAGRVDELQRKVRGAGSRTQAPLARDCVDALDYAILGQLGDAAHFGQSRRETGC